MSPSATPAIILAAGGVLSRETPEGDLVLLVLRKRHNDWTLPKGKIKGHESLPETALREVHEETGCVAMLGDYAGTVTYEVGRTPKVVFFWRMSVVEEGVFTDHDEVDQTEWVTPAVALERLTYPRESELITQLYKSLDKDRDRT